jgi:hypothetical protein
MNDPGGASGVGEVGVEGGVAKIECYWDAWVGLFEVKDEVG